MDFRITGLSPEPFRHLFGLPDAELAKHRAKRCIVGSARVFPERIEMRDGEPGEVFLLVNYVHQPAETPYRSSHAVYVREGAPSAYDRVNEVPEVLRRRTLSLRAFDAAHMMVDAAVLDGQDVESAIGRFFANSKVDYIHAHYAQPGCYAARIDRVAS